MGETGNSLGSARMKKAGMGQRAGWSGSLSESEIPHYHLDGEEMLRMDRVES